MAPVRILLFGATVLLAGPSLANDEACLKAARDHGSYKAILSDDPSGRPQFETVRRGTDDIVEATRYVAGEKRAVRITRFGIFGRENKFPVGGRLVSFGVSHSIDPARLMPLKPGTNVTYKTITVDSRSFFPQFTDVKFSVGAEHDVMLGACRLPAFDLTIVSRTASTGITATENLVFAPDIAYALQNTIELVDGAKVKTFVTNLRDIEDWQGD
jgi:hypothetical protein